MISYGSLKKTKKNTGYASFLLPKNPKMIITDEAHHFRHSNTKLSETINKFVKIPYRLALTGTPAYGKAEDIYNILHFLFPETFYNEWKFKDYYLKKTAKYVPLPHGNYRIVTEYTDFKPAKKIELQTFLNNTCTQRKRTDVMKWLPKKDKQLIELPLNKYQEKYLKELSEKFETEDLTTASVISRLIRYRQICLDPELLGLKGTSPKTQWVLDVISENPDTPVIIFSNFTEYLKKLFNTLKEQSIKEALIIGEITPIKRAKFQEDFQSGKFNVFLINTMAGKEALTLDRAEAIIFTDTYPPIGAIEQAEDRFIATTEKYASKPHTIYNLVMKNSYDETIVQLLNKRKTETEVINNFRAQLQIHKKEETL